MPVGSEKPFLEMSSGSDRPEAATGNSNLQSCLQNFIQDLQSTAKDGNSGALQAIGQLTQGSEELNGHPGAYAVVPLGRLERLEGAMEQLKEDVGPMGIDILDLQARLAGHADVERTSDGRISALEASEEGSGLKQRVDAIEVELSTGAVIRRIEALEKGLEHALSARSGAVTEPGPSLTKGLDAFEAELRGGIERLSSGLHELVAAPVRTGGPVVQGMSSSSTSSSYAVSPCKVGPPMSSYAMQAPNDLRSQVALLEQGLQECSAQVGQQRSEIDQQLAALARLLEQGLQESSAKLGQQHAQIDQQMADLEQRCSAGRVQLQKPMEEQLVEHVHGELTNLANSLREVRDECNSSFAVHRKSMEAQLITMVGNQVRNECSASLSHFSSSLEDARKEFTVGLEQQRKLLDNLEVQDFAALERQVRVLGLQIRGLQAGLRDVAQTCGMVPADQASFDPKPRPPSVTKMRLGPAEIVP